MSPRSDERLLVDAWMQSPGRDAALRVAEWLDANSSTFSSVLEIDLRHERCLVLDFGLGSALLNAPDADNREPALTARIRRSMADAGVRVAVGRYDELRPSYESSRDDPSDQRGVHLGIDVFVEPGMMVHAPIAGIVHDSGTSRSALGFGPTVVLRHQTGYGTPFFTLYGHLDREAPSLCPPGRVVAPGTRLGRIGTPDVNGGWTPHLHFQLTVDLLGLGRRFPGMGRLAQREAWRELCPNPNLVLGIPVLS